MSIEKKTFGVLPDGRAVELYTIQNRGGMILEVIPYGCRMVRLLVPGRNGQLGDVILGHDTLEEYFSDFQGALIGRFANRIAGAAFTIDGQEYPLLQNDGAICLHGGSVGFANVLWEVGSFRDEDDPSITFTYTSPHGESGFPGKVRLQVTYVLAENGSLLLDYQAESDRETPLNLTNHSYFNLSGDPSQNIFNTVLQINADQVTAVTDDLIPTGELLDVTGTHLDFRTPKPIGQDIFCQDHLMQVCGGYDHNYVIHGSGMRKAAEAWEPASGRVMECFTDLPGMQLYTANRMSGEEKGKGGVPMKDHNSFCLETQFYPDSVHHANFPYENLKPGEKFHSQTVYRFSVR